MALALTDQGQTAIEMEVHCSKGTYVRTLAQDVGEALGCGAHLAALRRLATGDFGVAQCVTLAALEQMPEAQRLTRLLPTDSLLQNYRRIDLDADNARRFSSGLSRRGPWPDVPQVAVYALDSGTLLGTGRVMNGELLPTRLLSPAEIEQLNCDL